MTAVSTVYVFVLRALAAVAAVTIALSLGLIVGDVLLRNLGVSPLADTVALTEYGLLYTTVAGAPWLLHIKGHIYIEIVIDRLSPRLRLAVEKLICAIGAATCAIIAWAALEITIGAFANHEFDIRSFPMPRGALYGGVALSFFLMTLEFIRVLAGRDPLYGAAGSARE